MPLVCRALKLIYPLACQPIPRHIRDWVDRVERVICHTKLESHLQHTDFLLTGMIAECSVRRSAVKPTILKLRLLQERQFQWILRQYGENDSIPRATLLRFLQDQAQVGYRPRISPQKTCLFHSMAQCSTKLRCTGPICYMG